jgi:hypothetical protein
LYDPKTRFIDLDDESLTENTRASYPMDFIYDNLNQLTHHKNNCNAPSFSPDGKHILYEYFTDDTNTTIKIGDSDYNWDSMQALGPIDETPAGSGNGTAFSPDGQYMSVAHYSPPYITIYRATGGSENRVDLIVRGGKIDADQVGFAHGDPGTSMNGYGAGGTNGAAGYGGTGGQQSRRYGSAAMPLDPGSGGYSGPSAGNPGGNGGKGRQQHACWSSASPRRPVLAPCITARIAKP